MTNNLRTPRDITRREYAVPRTAIYRLVYGDARTGLGHADPARDGRKKPRYETPCQFYTAGSAFAHHIPLCGFDADKRDGLLRIFNALRPSGARPLVLFKPAPDVADEVDLDHFIGGLQTMPANLRPEGIETMLEIDLTHIVPDLPPITEAEIAEIEAIPAQPAPKKARAPRKPKAAPAEAHVGLPIEPVKKARAPRKPKTPVVEAL